MKVLIRILEGILVLIGLMFIALHVAQLIMHKHFLPYADLYLLDVSLILFLSHYGRNSGGLSGFIYNNWGYKKAPMGMTVSIFSGFICIVIIVGHLIIPR